MNNLATVSAFTFGVQAFITLFVILDPPGATPIFLSLVKNENRKRQKRLAWEGAFSSLVIIVVFALFGQVILDSLHISINALQGAGGLLLFLISMELLTGKDGGDKSLSDNVNVAMVPLGTPILAGPGAIVTTMLYVQYADSGAAKLSLAAAIVAVHVVIGFTLMYSTAVIGLIKETGVTLVARVAGLLVAAIAVEMMVQAIKGFFNLA